MKDVLLRDCLLREQINRTRLFKTLINSSFDIVTPRYANVERKLDAFHWFYT